MLKRIKQKRDSNSHAKQAEQHAQKWDELLEKLQLIVEALEAGKEQLHDDQKSD